jgi:hypothetical protein
MGKQTAVPAVRSRFVTIIRSVDRDLIRSERIPCTKHMDGTNQLLSLLSTRKSHHVNDSAWRNPQHA